MSDICDRYAGPIPEGRLRGAFVVCPWHSWEYSVITGKSPDGYDKEERPVYRLETRVGMYVVPRR